MHLHGSHEKIIDRLKKKERLIQMLLKIYVYLAYPFYRQKEGGLGNRNEQSKSPRIVVEVTRT